MVSPLRKSRKPHWGICQADWDGTTDHQSGVGKLAREEHLQKAFTGQLADSEGGRFASIIRSIIRELNTISEEHALALRDLAERRERVGQAIITRRPP